MHTKPMHTISAHAKSAPAPFHGTIAARQVRVLISAVDAMGFSGDRALGRIGLARDRLDDPNARLPAELDSELWEAVIAETGNPACSLRLAEQFAPGAFGSFEYVLRNCETLAQAVERANELMRLLDDFARVDARSEHTRVTMRLFRTSGCEMPGPGVECVFAVLALIGRGRGGRAVALSEVRFKHVRRAALSEYESFFGCPVRFGAEHNELVAHESMFHAPMAADANLRQLMEDHARHQLRQVPDIDPFVSSVRTRLLNQLREGPPNLSVVTRALHLSERTLRRRLQAAGTGYHELLDELRAQLALDYVRQTDAAIGTLAERLGFRDPSTFYRAFKRWTGMTPAQYRRAQSERGAAG